MNIICIRLFDGKSHKCELVSPGHYSASWCSCCGPRGGSTSAGAQGQAGTSRFGAPGQEGKAPGQGGG